MCIRDRKKNWMDFTNLVGEEIMAMNLGDCVTDPVVFNQIPLQAFLKNDWTWPPNPYNHMPIPSKKDVMEQAVFLNIWHGYLDDDESEYHNPQALKQFKDLVEASYKDDSESELTTGNDEQEASVAELSHRAALDKVKTLQDDAFKYVETILDLPVSYTHLTLPTKRIV